MTATIPRQQSTSISVSTRTLATEDNGIQDFPIGIGFNFSAPEHLTGAGIFDSATSTTTAAESVREATNGDIT